MSQRLTPPIVGLVGAVVLTLVAAGASLGATRTPLATGVSEPDWYCIGANATNHQACPNGDAIDRVTHDTGRKPAIWSLWSDWSSTGDGGTAPFPTDLVANLKSRGITPQIYWEPGPSDVTQCAEWQLSTIYNGKHDTYIKKWAQDANASGATIILRFAHEMNGSWYIWSNSWCNNSTAKFRKAWQYVWNKFRGSGGAGATNVKFEFSVYGTKNVAADYPGNRYVDYLGLTALNWGAGKHTVWKSLVNTMSPVMTSLRKLSTTKPIIAGEVASAPDQKSYTKSAWITKGYPAAYQQWGQLAAIVYFDYDMRSVNQPDWRLGSPATAMAAYQSILNNPNFQGTFPQ